jgi:ERCC4-related helicase
LLVATSVAEEGLDIRQCNVVIRFDLAKTVLAYIQSRGRARKPGSDYILMVERYFAMAVSSVGIFLFVLLKYYFLEL